MWKLNFGCSIIIRKINVCPQTPPVQNHCSNVRLLSTDRIPVPLVTLHHHLSVLVTPLNILHFVWCVWQVAFHIQPYKGRTDQSMHDNIKYIIDKWVALPHPICSALPPPLWMRYANRSGVVVKYRCVLLQSGSKWIVGWLLFPTSTELNVLFLSQPIWFCTLQKYHSPQERWHSLSGELVSDRRYFTWCLPAPPLVQLKADNL